MRRLGHSIEGLEQALLEPPRLPQTWRYLVRQRLAWVEKALIRESTSTTEPWLDPRATTLAREREKLLARVTTLCALVCESTEIEPVRQNLQRFVVEARHYAQHINDLAYDSVGMDVGGSD